MAIDDGNDFDRPSPPPVKKESGGPSPLSLAWTATLSALLTLTALIAALKFFPRAEVYSGIAAGWLTAVLNYAMLVRLIQGLTSQSTGAGKLRMAGLLVLKMLLLIAVIAGAFWWLKVDALAFAAGYMCLIATALLLSLVASP